VSPEQINDALLRLNILRGEGLTNEVQRELLEGALEALFAASRHLIVYGSLSPGGPNHGILDSIRGEWREGWISGELVEAGWGAAMGYPALRWCPDGDRIDAHLLISRELPQHWGRLDDFEGLEYDRILAPFFDSSGLIAVGNLYALKCEGSP
jgi:gamma-glutamylcyclotransferase (GGCT)/AIG2-like uncharacterized protein YtfP